MQEWEDPRAQATRTYETPWQPPRWPDRAAWERRAATLRAQVIAASGLWLDPATERRAPPAAEVFERREFADLGFAVEKVRIESLPGYFITGNLYSPCGRGGGGGRRAAILNPHGHQPNGRFQDDVLVSTPRRCITWARMGYTALTHDMAGLGDNTSVPHRWGGPAEWLHAASPLGLQLWNCVRALDFLQGLPGVDPLRLGCTGESGGGTQTFLLTAVDPRVAVAAPVTMVSAFMQGGCVCENAPGLRLDASNVEIAALAAPRPLLMVSATGDWTDRTPWVEFPAVRDVYRLYGREDAVSNVHVDAPHNYNRVSREAVYRWFQRWLPPVEGSGTAIAPEEDVAAVPPREALEVYARRPRPDGPESARAAERVTGWFAERDAGDAVANLAAMAGVERVAPGDVAARRDGGGWRIGRRGRPEAAMLVEGDVAEAPLRLRCGASLWSLWPFLTGAGAAPWGRAGRAVGAEFFLTYNRSDAAWRAQDLLTAVAWLRRDAGDPAAVVAREDVATAALLACAMDPGGIAALDARLGPEWQAGETAGWLHAGNYLPGALRAGGLRGLCSACGGRASLRPAER